VAMAWVGGRATRGPRVPTADRRSQCLTENEVKCHNIEGFGGLWLAVTSAGKAAPV
jgi:hypothetical protein